MGSPHTKLCTCFLITAIWMGHFTSLFAQDSVPVHDTPVKVFQFEIDEEIFKPALRKLESAMEQASEKNADVILMKLNTFGGEVNVMDEMRGILLSAEQPVICYITSNAASAGALLAISCDSIYMASGATIGAATVVNQSGEVAPDKYQSYFRKKFRSTAEQQGRDPDIAEAMVDPDKEIEGLIEKGKVLTFTATEALQYDYCDGIVASAEEALALAGYDQYELMEYEPTWVDRAIGKLTHPAVSGILITIMFFGIFFELQTPGVGFPLGAAIIAAMLYFSPLYLEGLAEEWEILIFIIGFVLIAVEVFALPGFGIAGFAGILFVFSALVLSLIGNIQFDFSFTGLGDITQSFVTVIAAILATIMLLLLFGRRFHTSPLTRALIFKDTLDSSEGAQVDSFRGSDLLHKKGVAVTDLRPAGKVEIDDERYDAYTAGEWIEGGDEVIVLRAKGISLIVQKVENSSD